MKIRKWPPLLITAALLLGLIFPVPQAARALPVTPPLNDIDEDAPVTRTETLIDSSRVDEMNWSEAAIFTLRSSFGGKVTDFGDQLDPNQRAVYEQLVSLSPSTASISINLPEPLQGAGGLRAVVQPAIDAALYDRPDLFWLKLGNGGCTFEYTDDAEISQIQVQIVSQYKNAASLKQSVADAVADIIVTGSTPYERVRFIHDQLCKKIKYATGDLSVPSYHDVVGALVNGIAVCEGYAKAFKLLCDREEIPCKLVAGRSVTSAGGGPHMWNAVQLDGKWYAVDVTWDDQPTSANPGRIVYDFFLAGSNTPQINFTPVGAIFSHTHLERGDLSNTGLKTFIYPEIQASAYAYTSNDFTIVRHPEDKDAVRDTRAMFSVTASGGSLPYTYTWEVDRGGSNWESASAVGTGGDTDTLTIDPVTASMNGWKFRCSVADNSSSAGEPLKSEAATLRVTDVASPLLIVMQPQDATVDIGSPAEFSVNVRGGTAAYTYQWQVKRDSISNWVNITEADITGVKDAIFETLLTAPTAQAMNGYQYRCVITDASQPQQSVTTNTATLSLQSAATPFAIKTQPASATVAEPQKAVFTVEATGGTPIYVYQWQRNGVDGWTNVTAQDGTGGNTGSFITAATTTEMTGTQYRCLLRDSANTLLTSEAATLTVNRASDLYIARQPADALVAPGARPAFSVEARGGQAPYTYAWQIKKGAADWTGVTAQDGAASGASLTCTAATLTMNGYQLRCAVTDASGATAITRAAQLLVAKAGDPGSGTGTGDGSGDDSGSSGLWDWISRLLGLGEDADKKDDADEDPDPVTNTDYMTFGPNGMGAWTAAGTSATASDTPAITAAYAANGTSGAGTLTPSMPIEIRTPTVQSVTERSVYIAFEARGLYEPLSYQWWKQVAPGSYELIPGATSPNLSETEFTPGTAYTARCIVRDSRGFGVISPDVTFTTANAAVPAGQLKTGNATLGETRIGTINGNRVNVRATASTHGKKLGACNKGNPVVVLGPAVNGFYPIRWTSSTDHAYVYVKYVTLK